jgi:hypothetical protein
MKELADAGQWTISPADVAHLVEKLQSSGLLDTGGVPQKAPQNTSSHKTTSTTSLGFSGTTSVAIRQIGGTGAPSPRDAQLKVLEREIEKVAGAEQRIRDCCFQGTSGPLP